MKAEVDLGIAWDWEYDADFIAMLDRTCRGLGISTCVIGTSNLRELGPEVTGGSLRMRAFLDRASDTDSDFEPLVRSALGSGAFFVNYPPYAAKAVNKASMHLEFLSHGVNVPYTIILPVFEKDPTEHILKFDSVGIPFIIKPAHGGGGDGVLLDAKTISEVMAARKDFVNDQILIQENIIPRLLDGRKAYFRAYYAGGTVAACWWDPQAHVSQRLLPDEASRYGLQEVERIVARIHRICRLNFFSTEIALTEDGKFISVDYVNEPCDMRLKSKAWDGVPDEVVQIICDSLARLVGMKIGRGSPPLTG